jgi:membrane-associated protease RseP (regulator of RpoE activity)
MNVAWVFYVYANSPFVYNVGQSGMKEEKYIVTVTRLLEDLFEIVAVFHRGDRLEFSLTNRFNKDASVTLISDRLRLAGYDFTIDQQEPQILLRIDPKPRLKIPPLNIILFGITLFTVYFVPVFLSRLTATFVELAENDLLPSGESLSAWQQLKLTLSLAPVALDSTVQALAGGAGIEFTLALISILFVHEMGHFIASRRRNIVTSWPYFIPAPNIIGTFGAVIKSKSPFWNRRDLIEVGSAGPIAGWIIAVAWLCYGLTQSVYIPQEAFPPWEMGFSLEGESILMRFLTTTLVGAAPEGHFYRLTEAAFAGWVGLLVTAINLLPIGQLDGGHIIYGLGRKRQHLLGLIAMGVLLILGMESPIWWFFAAFGIIFGVKHPRTLNDSKNPGSPATGMGLIALIILIISFTPIPFR